MEEKIEKLIQWLRDQVADAGLNGAIVGISGGIDSAVVAHLIKRAFPDNSLGLIMPCKSNPKDMEDALKVVESCGIKHLIIDLTETHNLLFGEVEKQLKEKGEWNEETARLGDANTRARLRMTTLYAVANNYGYMVVGTDNAAEWYTGYFTKYGDGGVDLVPLVHFTKGEVREMARILGVPNEIITKAPSAGLWEGQTDENEMGTTYEMIDKYLKGEEVPEKDRQIIERLHKRSQHKRQLAIAPPKF
ncbi:NAD(+) synthase [Parageobacillus toebii NBRC 107807]|uniref:NH(3)-dependent NAD(+) synthetase n=3 Tax=Anoxybacillaceae TaxID=3120669 RepID=A0A6G9J046_9BACL|nr:MULTISPECIES: NAD(+) synthase [Parageobacillus]OQP01346.1 NAD(+) synthetase [Geobacillus sp. 44C]MBB3867580.1 NAD+ synthase [Parageobacillus toebii NBRC 107807]MED4969545.1 NAD(+) synthase [Parageobacillus toebii]MED4988650.1 NAD(+) synthase [Parageobacillus toebii]OXB92536.1 NAD(+) synthetase [Parageobacillus galactosidasius]